MARRREMADYFTKAKGFHSIFGRCDSNLQADNRRLRSSVVDAMQATVW